MRTHRAAGLNQLSASAVGKTALRRGQYKSTYSYPTRHAGGNCLKNKIATSAKNRKVKITLADHA